MLELKESIVLSGSEVEALNTAMVLSKNLSAYFTGTANESLKNVSAVLEDVLTEVVECKAYRIEREV